MKSRFTKMQSRGLDTELNRNEYWENWTGKFVTRRYPRKMLARFKPIVGRYPARYNSNIINVILASLISFVILDCRSRLLHLFRSTVFVPHWVTVISRRVTYEEARALGSFCVILRTFKYTIKCKNNDKERKKQTRDTRRQCTILFNFSSFRYLVFVKCANDGPSGNIHTNTSSTSRSLWLNSLRRCNGLVTDQYRSKVTVTNPISQ